MEQSEDPAESSEQKWNLSRRTLTIREKIFLLVIMKIARKKGKDPLMKDIQRQLMIHYGTEIRTEDVMGQAWMLEDRGFINIEEKPNEFVGGRRGTILMRITSLGEQAVIENVGVAAEATKRLNGHIRQNGR